MRNAELEPARRAWRRKVLFNSLLGVKSDMISVNNRGCMPEKRIP
jgi:hypothetical protein